MKKLVERNLLETCYTAILMLKILHKRKMINITKHGRRILADAEEQLAVIIGAKNNK